MFCRSCPRLKWEADWMKTVFDFFIFCGFLGYVGGSSSPVCLSTESVSASDKGIVHECVSLCVCVRVCDSSHPLSWRSEPEDWGDCCIWACSETQIAQDENIIKYFTSSLCSVELHVCLTFVWALYEFIMKAGFLCLPVVMIAEFSSEELHSSVFVSEDWCCVPPGPAAPTLPSHLLAARALSGNYCWGDKWGDKLVLACKMYEVSGHGERCTWPGNEWCEGASAAHEPPYSCGSCRETATPKIMTQIFQRGHLYC